MMRDKLIIFGCGGHSRSVVDVAMSVCSGYEIVFVDNNAIEGEKIFGFNVVNSYNVTDEKVFIAVGDNRKRAELYKQYKNNLINIISNSAYIGSNVVMGSGIFVAHNSHIGVQSILGDCVIVNSCASIDHECVIGSFCHIAPNTTLCGRVKVGCYSTVGAGATIIDKVSISDNIFIGAGAVVIKDIITEGIYTGIPAKKNN